MALLMKRLLVYWLGATLYCLFTAEPYDPEGGIMGIVKSEQMYAILAQGFYYGAIIMAVQRLFERSKENRERAAKQEERAAAEAALASPAFAPADDADDDADDDAEDTADADEDRDIADDGSDTDSTDEPARTER